MSPPALIRNALTTLRALNSPDVKTSMTVACLIQDVRIENPRWHANLVEQNAIEFQEISEAAEKVGWCEFLAVIKKIRTSGINWVNS
jgi:5,10-methylenetetrahydrofolate reductase